MALTMAMANNLVWTGRMSENYSPAIEQGTLGRTPPSVENSFHVHVRLAIHTPSSHAHSYLQSDPSGGEPWLG